MEKNEYLDMVWKMNKDDVPVFYSLVLLSFLSVILNLVLYAILTIICWSYLCYVKLF